MRKLFFISQLLFASLLMQAQTNVYHPFPDSNAVWRVTYLDAPPPPPVWGFTSYYEYALKGDTVVGVYTYKKITKTYIDFFCTTTTGFGSSYVGSIREDTIAQKVYFLPDGSANDTLLYDFKLKMGDTLPLTYNNACPPTIVQSADSILISGQYRRRLNVAPNNSCSQGPFALIEGIGSSTGLLEALYDFEGGGRLRCFLQNNNLLYSAPTSSCHIFTDTCTIDIIINETSIKEHINVYPNPFYDKVYIKREGNHVRQSNCKIKIFDINGKKLMLQQLDNDFTTINVKNISYGMYFYLIEDSGFTILAKGKLIKLN